MDTFWLGLLLLSGVGMIFCFAKAVYHAHLMRKNLALLATQLKEIEKFIEEQL